jgi:hypothetical protein
MSSDSPSGEAPRVFPNTLAIRYADRFAVRSV